MMPGGMEVYAETHSEITQIYKELFVIFDYDSDC